MAAEVPKLARFYQGATPIPEVTNFKRSRKGTKIKKKPAFTDTAPVQTAGFGDETYTFEINRDVLDSIHQGLDPGDSFVGNWYPQGNTTGKPVLSGTVTITDVDEEFDSESYNTALVTLTGAMTWGVVP